MGVIRGGNEGVRRGEETKRRRREQRGERITLSKKTTSSKRAGDNTGIQLLTSVNASSRGSLRGRISPHPLPSPPPTSRPLPPELSRIRDEKYVSGISIDLDGIPLHF